MVLIGLEDMKHRILWLRDRADEVRKAAQGMRYAETRDVLFRMRSHTKTWRRILRSQRSA